MGAVTFTLDVHLVKILKKALPLSVFVETGTFRGDTLASMLPFFDRLITVEFSKPLWKGAVARFENIGKVETHFGNSPEVLNETFSALDRQSILFWLDAHWCVADSTAGDKSQCPLLLELAAIKYLNNSSVLLIDDARLFLAPPPEPHEVTQWPSFDEIVIALRLLSKEHKLMVINDVIVFYPKSAQEQITSYARKIGVDWLRANQSLTENLDLRNAVEEKETALLWITKSLEEKEIALLRLSKSLEEKETVLLQLTKNIQEKETALLRLTKNLADKEVIIQNLSHEVEDHRSAPAIFRYATYPMKIIFSVPRKVRHRLQSIFAFRLGRLIQYAPRKLCIPAYYTRPIQVSHPPQISIVTPSFKHVAFIERTIKSVLDQNYPNLEYFVQDGGSADGTDKILRRYDDRLTGWKSCPDSGQSEAINLGFLRTTGEIMAWLNSDDILLTGALAYVAEYFNHHPKVDVVYGHRIMIDENDQQIGRWMLPAHDDEVLSWSDYIPQETMFWRRRIWEKVGGQIDESFRFAMDWDLLVRFRDAGARFIRLPRFLGGFRIHMQQKTSAEIAGIGVQEMTRIRQRLLGRVPSDEEIYKAVLPYMRKHIATDLWWRVRYKLGLPT